jgi:hypothetical protein
MTVLTDEEREMFEKDHKDTIEFIKSLENTNASLEDLLDYIALSTRRIEIESVSIEKTLKAMDKFVKEEKINTITNQEWEKSQAIFLEERKETLEYYKKLELPGSSLAELSDFMEINRRELELYIATYKTILRAMKKLVEETQEGRKDE